MVKIKEIPLSDRPIERLFQKGSESLSNEELLAILLRTGTKDTSSKDLANNILAKINNIQELKKMKIDQLLKIKGIGKSKASIIMSLIELAHRINMEIPEIKLKKANHPEILFTYYKDILKDKTQEHFYAVFLDMQKKIITDKLLFIGTVNYSLVHPRDIFKEAYLHSAAFIILIHNHPTGNVIPSSNDIETTKNLIQVGNLLGIPVIDHIIIGKHKYYSFYENHDI